jgi:UDP-N-acetylmuramyl pentapeptide phosphotransferase/UDP-N-acetylglucosamine-1-phosphate transferase
MIYLLIFVLLFAAELLYFKVAKRYKIVDIPNGRSSHDYITIRGGGIIFWFAAILYVAFNPSMRGVLLLFGLSMIAGVSFWDDITGVSFKTRLLFHLMAITVAFYLTSVFGAFPWWAIVIAYVVFIGIVNAYNFMDGINGMTGMNSLVMLLSLQYVNYEIVRFVTPDFIWYAVIATLVFLFFNFRTKAKCFAGDVGAIGLGFWVVVLVLLLMIKTNNLIWIGLMMIYGVETVCTILHRIHRKENITKPHRLHLFQILVNERELPHLTVSTAYAVAQAICSILLISLYPVMGGWIFFALLAFFVAVYCVKFKLIKISTEEVMNLKTKDVKTKDVRMAN